MKNIEVKKASVQETIELISRLNYRNDTFEYHFTTREDNADVKYRNFDAYRENGEKDSFAITEVVVDGTLAAVRFYNLFRDIVVEFQLTDREIDHSHFDNVINADAEIEVKEETKMTIETRIAKNGNVSFYVEGKRINEQDAVYQAAMNDGTYYSAHSYSYSGRSSSENFLSPITAYKWLRRLASKNRNHADGTWIIKRHENRTCTEIYEDSDNRYKCEDTVLEAYIEEREAAEHIKITYRSMLNLVEHYSKHYGLTLEQAEQICVTIYAADQRKQYDTKAVINRMIEDFQAANAAAAEPIDDESPFEIDDESPFELLPSIDELNDTLSDFEIEDEQFAGEDTDRNARFNRGERLAEAATSRIRKFDKTAEITFDVNEDGEDTFLLDSSTIYRTPFGTAADAEQAFFDIIGIEETAEIDLANDTCEDIFQKLIPAAEKEISVSVESFSKAHEIIQSVNANFEFEGEVQGFQGNINLVERFFRAPYTTYSFVEYFTDSGDLHHIDFKNGAGFRARVIKIFIESHVDDTPIVETVCLTEDGNEFRRFTVNNETVTYFNGELNFIQSDTYHASLAAYRNQYVVEVPDGQWKKFKRLDVDEFHQFMSERGACTFDEPADGGQKIISMAEYHVLINQANEILNGQLDNATKIKKFLKNRLGYTVDTEEILAYISMDELNGFRRLLAQFPFLVKDSKEHLYKIRVCEVGHKVRAKLHECTDTDAACDLINEAAPKGWKVDADNDKFNVKFNGQSVATLDSLALAKILPPEQFFDQFTPLADKKFDAKKQFVADRQREIEQLKEMREELADDPERLKIIDKLITQNELAS